MIRNIRHRFRDAEQYNSQELFYMFEYLHGRCIAEPLGKKVLYLKPRKKQSYFKNVRLQGVASAIGFIPMFFFMPFIKTRKKQSYIDDKLRRFRQNKEAIFCCINALCIANEADQKKVLNWLNEKIDQNL